MDFAGRFHYHAELVNAPPVNTVRRVICSIDSIGGPPRIAWWQTWSGPEGSSHSYFLQVPGVRLASFLKLDSNELATMLLLSKRAIFWSNL